MMKRIKSNDMRGFSIIELTVVIVVLGILTAIVYVSYNSIVKANDEESLKTAVQTAGSSIDTYKSNNGVYPTTAVFNTMTIQGVGSDISLRYVPDAISGVFCVDATRNDMTVRLSSDQRRPVEGACPAAAPGG